MPYGTRAPRELNTICRPYCGADLLFPLPGPGDGRVSGDRACVTWNHLPFRALASPGPGCVVVRAILMASVSSVLPLDPTLAGPVSKCAGTAMSTEETLATSPVDVYCGEVRFSLFEAYGFPAAHAGGALDGDRRNVPGRDRGRQRLDRGRLLVLGPVAHDEGPADLCRRGPHGVLTYADVLRVRAGRGRRAGTRRSGAG